MDVAFVEYAEHDVDGNERRQDQDWLVGQRSLKGGRCSLEAGIDACRHLDSLLGQLYGCNGIAQRLARRQVEADNR